MKRILLLISGLALSLSVSARAEWNDGLQRSTPEAQGVSSEAVANVFKALDEGGYNVHSLMILRHGKVIAGGTHTHLNISTPCIQQPRHSPRWL